MLQECECLGSVRLAFHGLRYYWENVYIYSPVIGVLAQREPQPIARARNQTWDCLLPRCLSIQSAMVAAVVPSTIPSA